MDKKDAKDLVIEWRDYALESCGLRMSNSTISFFVLQFIDFLYKNRYSIETYQERTGKNKKE